MFFKSLMIFLAVLLVAISAAAQPGNEAEKKVVQVFEGRIQEYMTLREDVRKAAPPVSTHATAAQIHAHKLKLQAEVRRRRSGLKEGNLFVPGTDVYFRKLIKQEFPGEMAAELRRQVQEADTNGVPIKVNAVYPESKELVQMPPPLLLTLPQLPNDLRYRFVGSAMVVVDRDAALILDVLRNALP
jgi:hypothetical protein